MYKLETYTCSWYFCIWWQTRCKYTHIQRNRVYIFSIFKTFPLKREQKFFHPPQRLFCWLFQRERVKKGASCYLSFHFHPPSSDFSPYLKKYIKKGSWGYKSLFCLSGTRPLVHTRKTDSSAIFPWERQQDLISGKSREHLKLRDWGGQNKTGWRTQVTRRKKVSRSYITRNWIMKFSSPWKVPSREEIEGKRFFPMYCPAWENKWFGFVPFYCFVWWDTEKVRHILLCLMGGWLNIFTLFSSFPTAPINNAQGI